MSLAGVGNGQKTKVYNPTPLKLVDAEYEAVESAAVLSTLYGRFIEVWRQKEAIVQKNRMTRLLIRNAGHEGKHILFMLFLVAHNI
jgi:hypothetical protein